MTAAHPVAQAPAKSLSNWRFWLPLVLQAALILGIPAPAAYLHLTGRPIVIKTIPVDPYDFLRGYSVILNYEISRFDTLRKLAGWETLEKDPNSKGQALEPGSYFYVVLQAPASTTQPPQPWQPVRVSRDRPTDLTANQAILQGQATYGGVEYDLETYYIPEDQRNEINDDINQARWGRQPRPIVVEVKVNRQGDAVPASFWVGDRRYRF
jgi:uncharacterized membrane-anchored protein